MGADQARTSGQSCHCCGGDDVRLSRTVCRSVWRMSIFVLHAVKFPARGPLQVHWKFLSCEPEARIRRLDHVRVCSRRIRCCGTTCWISSILSSNVDNTETHFGIERLPEDLDEETVCQVGAAGVSSSQHVGMNVNVQLLLTCPREKPQMSWIRSRPRCTSAARQTSNSSRLGPVNQVLSTSSRCRVASTQSFKSIIITWLALEFRLERGLAPK